MKLLKGWARDREALEQVESREEVDGRAGQIKRNRGIGKRKSRDETDE